MVDLKPLQEEILVVKKWLDKYALSAGISPLQHVILEKFDSWLTSKHYEEEYNVICNKCLGRLSRTNAHFDGVLQSAKICNDCQFIISHKDKSCLCITPEKMTVSVINADCPIHGV